MDRQLIDSLREDVLRGNNAAAFIEREKILDRCATVALTLPEHERYAYMMGEVLGGVSTPLRRYDLLAGNAVEDVKPAFARPAVPGGLTSDGHVTVNWETLLRYGLDAIGTNIVARAEKIGTGESRRFARNAENGIGAVLAFCQRYRQEAACLAAAEPNSCYRKNLVRIATALETVPARPATDFFSALQSIWMVHFIFSCYIGSRDFAFGRFDQYLEPYLAADLKSGRLTRDEAKLLLAGFMVKCNEITGTHAHNYQAKPTPCQASKQYLMLGGRTVDGRDGFNGLSELIVEAAELVKLPQPVLTFRIDPDFSASAWSLVGRAAAQLHGQAHFYHESIILAFLKKKNVPDCDAVDFSYVGCCRFELAGKSSQHMRLNYLYHNPVRWLLTALDGGKSSFATLDDLLQAFQEIARECFRQARDPSAAPLTETFRFESILIDDCAALCRDNLSGGARYHTENHFFGGLATIVDSLLAIDELVFRQRRFAFAEFMAIVGNDFSGHEALRQEIINNLPKYGNGEPVADRMARRIAEMLIGIVEAYPAPANHLLVPGFYSLDSHHRFGRELPATPDGRPAGEAYSENQSPSYGRDRQGVTALLQSLAALPFDRAPTGGVNLKIYSAASHLDKLGDLVRTYFRMGGLHLGITVTDKQDLIAAGKRPEEYRDLLVRMYGFSEYFVSLSPTEQQEVIDRTDF